MNYVDLEKVAHLFQNKFDQSKVKLFDYNHVKFQVGQRKGIQEMKKLTMKRAAVRTIAPLERAGKNLLKYMYHLFF